MSSPTLARVIAYEMEIRKRMTDRLNQGHDFRGALLHAQEDQEIRSVHFLQPVALESNSSAARAVSAPGVEKAGTKRKNEDGQQPSKRAKKRHNQAAKVAELQKQLAQAQGGRNHDQGKGGGRRNGGGNPNGQQNSGGNQQQQQPRGQPKGGDGAKGAGKGGPPAGAHSRKPGDGASICWGFNKPTGCNHGTSCRMKHVCWYCFQGDHGGHNCRAQRPQ